MQLSNRFSTGACRYCKADKHLGIQTYLYSGDRPTECTRNDAVNPSCKRREPPYGITALRFLIDSYIKEGMLTFLGTVGSAVGVLYKAVDSVISERQGKASLHA